MKFRKKPVVIDAVQWFNNGDHPEDDVFIKLEDGQMVKLAREGKVVRYYRTPDGIGAEKCPVCGLLLHDHGWIDTLEAGHRVCPGDWIITGVKGERYPCKPDIFSQTYELADEVRPLPTTDDIDAELRDAVLYNGQLSGYIFNDRKGRFADGSLVKTSLVRKMVAITQNTVYEVRVRESEDYMSKGGL